jgi:MFS family permease
MLSIGFVIIALFTSALYFNISSNVYALAVILFGTRVGAALVEVMCDVYFFKKVDQNNTNLISFFRMAKPLAYIVGPILALVFLNLFDLDIKSLFGILAIIMILGLRFSLCIKDTK